MSQIGDLVIYCDAKHEGLWFRDLSPLLSNATFAIIGPRGKNIDIIDKLIFYDRPDIILLNDGEPVMVLEKTSEVPSGHNIGQRLGRMVRSLEYEVPAIMFMPFDSMKHGKFSSLCNLNARVLDGYLSMWDIHSTPALAVNWPSDSDWELITDGSEDDEISALVHDFIQSSFDWNCNEFRRQRAHMAKEFTRRVAVHRPYAKPPPSVKIVSTRVLDSMIRQRSGDKDSLPAQWANRTETVIYTMGMTEEKCKRQDPYTGMQFLYDYQHCRTGVDPGDKYRNLILDFPNVSIKRWKEANPNNPATKSVLWYATANGFLLKDGLIEVRG
jgi:hypothetical protein